MSEQVRIDDVELNGRGLYVRIEDQLGGGGGGPPEPVTPPTVYFQQTALSVSEDAGVVVLGVSLSAVHVTDVTVTVDLGAAGSPGLTPGADFEWTDPLEVTIEAGERLPAVQPSITIIDDLEVELVDETHAFTVAGVEAGPQPGFGSGTEQALGAGDDLILTVLASAEGATPEISFSQSGLSLVEGDPTNTDVRVVVSEEPAYEVTADIVRTSAADPGSRLTIATDVTIPGSSPWEVALSITANEDNINGVETYVYELQNAAASGSIAIGANDELLVEVDDAIVPPDPPDPPDPLPSIYFLPKSLEVAEGGPAVPLAIRLTYAHSRDIQALVYLGTEPDADALTPGEDFTWDGPQVRTIPAGYIRPYSGDPATSNPDQPRTRIIDEGGPAEVAESYGFAVTAVELEGQAGYPPRRLDNGSELVLTVEANAGAAPAMFFTVSSIAIVEGGAVNTQVMVEVTNDPGYDVTADLVQIGGPPTGDPTLGDRFTIIEPGGDRFLTSITVPAGTSTFPLEIQAFPINDPQFNGLENYTFELQNVTGGTAAAGNPSTLVISVDDESESPAIFGWSESGVRITEPAAGFGNSSVEVDVQILNSAGGFGGGIPNLSFARNVFLNFSGPAVNNVDFTASVDGLLATEVVFAPFETVKTVRFNARDDTEIEFIEECIVSLTENVSSSISVIDSGGRFLTLSVVSANGGVGGEGLETMFEYPSIVVNEQTGDVGLGEIITVYVTMNEPFTASEVTWGLHFYGPNVNLNWASGGADIQGYDGTSVGPLPDSVTFAPGSTRATFQLYVPPYAIFEAASTGTPSLKWVVIELTQPPAPAIMYGDLGDVDRMIIMLEGDSDLVTNRRVPPEPANAEEFDDFRFYNDRVELLDLSGNVTDTIFASGGVWDRNNCPIKVIQRGGRSSQNKYVFERWCEKNGGDLSAGIIPTVPWMQKGREVIIRIMEDVPWRLGLGADSWYASKWEFELPNGNIVPYGQRDIRFIGDTGIVPKPIVGSVRLGVSDNNSGFAAVPDNLHFENLQILDNADSDPGTNNGTQTSNRCFSDNWPVGTGMEWSGGLMRVNNCLLRDPQDDMSTPWDPNFDEHSLTQFIVRNTNRLNYWFTDNDFGSATEHSFYINQAQGLMIFARNNSLRTSGRTQVQMVHRALNVAGACSNGLALIVGNVCDDFGLPPFENSTKVWTVYGFFGRMYCYDNTSSGDTVDQCARSGLAVINEEVLQKGIYIFEWPPTSGQYYSNLYTEVDNDTLTVDGGTGILYGNRFSFSGHYDLKIGSFTTTLVNNTGNPFIFFNKDSGITRYGPWNTASGLRPIRDQVGRRIDSIAPLDILNRPGAVEFTAGGPVNGSLLAYAGVAQSDRKYRHYETPEGPFIDFNPPPFESNGVEITVNDVNTYDGNTPTPGV